MVKFNKFKAALICLVMLIPGPAFSEKITNAPITNTRWYKVWGSGFHLGDLYIQYSENSSKINIKTVAKARGIAKKISNYSMKSESTARLVGEEIRPNIFSTNFILRKKERNISLEFDSDGNLKSESNIPPEIKGKRPPVSREEIKGAYDPLVAAMLVRQRIKTLIKNGKINKISPENPYEFTVPMYDGRRRSNLIVEVLGRTETNIGNEFLRAIHLTVYNKPVSGYTKNEIRDEPTQNPKINIWVSDDALVLPLKGEGQTKLGFAGGSLTRECKTLKECGVE